MNSTAEATVAGLPWPREPRDSLLEAADARELVDIFHGGLHVRNLNAQALLKSGQQLFELAEVRSSRGTPW